MHAQAKYGERTCDNLYQSLKLDTYAIGTFTVHVIGVKIQLRKDGRKTSVYLECISYVLVDR